MEAVTPVDLGLIEMRPNGRSYAPPSGMWNALGTTGVQTSSFGIGTL